jgi:hypothetical protein
VDTSVIWLNKILVYNGIDKSKFFEDVKAVMDKSVIKINSFWFYGQSNAGKSLVANSIVESARFYCNIMDFDERTSFPLNDAPGKRVIDKCFEIYKNELDFKTVFLFIKNIHRSPQLKK